MSQQHEQLVNEINDAFRQGNMEGFLERCIENVTWTMAGESKNTGKASIREWMKSMPDCPPPTFSVERMISTDDSVVCYGDMTMQGENGADWYSYCDIYRFEGGKVADLHSFVVKKKSRDA